MTAQKHLKQLVRERMTKTGESYTSARRQIIRVTPQPTNAPATARHFAGSVPAATALRVLLAHAGVRDPHTKRPFTEAMVFGIAGGIGIGVAAFHYAKENFSSFFIAGRHQWQDDLGYLKNAAVRFGVKPTVQESGGAKAADTQLREALAAGPCIAWVDMAHLPHRALPAAFSGGGYHIVTVYSIDGDTALLGDLTDKPVPIALADLATARARIKKQKNRILRIDRAKETPDLAPLVTDGLRACMAGLKGKPMKGYPTMFNLESLHRWADRLHGSKDKESWQTTFVPGVNLWRGLTSIHSFIEYYGTGGGLCRPLFAEFLTEAAESLGNTRMHALGERYAGIGRDWSALADAALPEGVPPFRHARQSYERYHELLTSNGSIEEKHKVWAKLDELAAQAGECFPVAAKHCDALRADLKKRVEHIVHEEESALAEMASIAAA